MSKLPKPPETDVLNQRVVDLQGRVEALERRGGNAPARVLALVVIALISSIATGALLLLLRMAEII